MDEVTIVKESYQLIRKDLGLKDQFEFKDEESDVNRLLDYLTSQINYLLDHDLNHLLNALYRIDIQEERIKDLLQNSEQGQIATNIAKAVIEREKQKVLTRRQYRM